MADLTLAAVSFTFQLFSGCIHGYQILSEAIGLPEEYQYVRVRIKTQQFRLLDWARIARISEDDHTLIVGRAGKAMLLDILEQQHKLLHRFGRFDERLKPLTKPLLSEVRYQAQREQEETAEEGSFSVQFPGPADLFMRASKYVTAAGTLPARVRWIYYDKKSIDNLLIKITLLNDVLTELLSKDQISRLLELQTRTHYGIMQLNSSVDQLRTIIRSDSSILSSEVSSTPEERSSEANLTSPTTAKAVGDGSRFSHIPPECEKNGISADGLAPLAKFKALSLLIRQGRLNPDTAQNLGLAGADNRLTTPELCKNDFCFLDPIPDMDLGFENSRTEAIYYDRKHGSNDTYVWIEWKHECIARAKATSNGLKPRGNNIDTSNNERLAALVFLLRHGNNTRLFRAARCIGYLRDQMVTSNAKKGSIDYRYGLVFVKPANTIATSRPISLLDLLQNQGQPPSLTQRVSIALALAESLERLHAVNWLHKGFRSSNVLFFKNDSSTLMPSSSYSGSDALGLNQPVISGFEYARPDYQPLWTETWCNPAHDLYRHPEVLADSGWEPQGDRTSMFKKVYDIYALGVVLLEIGFWKPINVILDVDLENCGLRDTIPARARLLQEPQFLLGMESSMGDVMCGVTRACLIGMESFGLTELDDELIPEIGLRLQQEFYSKVVQKLRTIHV